MGKIHVHKTKKSICAHFAESPCICAKWVLFQSIRTKHRIKLDCEVDLRFVICYKITNLAFGALNSDLISINLISN